MHVPRSLSRAAFAGIALTILGCDDPSGPPAPGAVSVVVVGTGEDVIYSGLRVRLASGAVSFLDSATRAVIITGFAPGVHTLQLEGMSTNCQVAAPHPRPVTVTSNDTTLAEFTLVCARRVGSIRVTTVTTGAELDPDGYVASMAGRPNQAVVVNGTTTFADVREGQYTVTLSGISSNCRTVGSNTRPATVLFGGTADVTFAVQCVTSGSLEVTVSTTGVDLDPNGFVVDVHTDDFQGSLGIPVNGSVTFTRLLPGNHSVTLQGVAANCDVVGAAGHTVGVVAGVTSRVAFTVSCQKASLLAFGREGEVYVMSSDGTGITRLTTDPAWDEEPAWSSTGRIAFTSYRHGEAELYVMNDDGTSQRRITTTAGTDDAPSWSPDGQKIVFRSSRDTNDEIYVANADGSGITRLTNNAAKDVQPAWSTTGKIAFISDRDHPSGEIYVMNADGSNVIRLTANDSAEFNPAWSPDGSMIAFARVVNPAVFYYNQPVRDIFVMNANGSNVRRLATGLGGFQDHSDPSWSPDGRTIAFTRHYCPYYCETPSVWLVNVEGSHLAMITDNGFNPAWKP